MGRPKKNAATPNKSEFIRSHAGKTAPEIVALGQAAGLKFSTSFVHTVRANAKKSAAKAGATSGRKPGRPAGSKNRVHTNGANSGAISMESTFRRLVVELGVGRARDLVGEVEGKLHALISGL